MVMDSETVLLSWRPPRYPNGKIRKYKVYMRSLDGLALPKDEFDLPADQTYYSITHLKLHHRYEFWATAFTVVGEGVPSRHVVQAPAYNVPARIASFSESVISAWKEELRLPCRMVGASERVWKMNGMSVHDDAHIQIFPDGSLVISSVQSTDAGNYSCSVENRFGKDEIIYAVVVQVPLAPADFHVTDTTTSTITSVWKQANAIGNIVQGYYLYYKREFGEWEKVRLPLDSTSHTLRGLQCGTKYQIFVRGYNQLGLGNPTATILSRTQGVAPVAPKDTELIRVNSTSISLNLGAWKDGDCPITSLVVEYKPKLGSDWTLVSNNIKFDAVEFLVLDLSPETWYTLRMTAHNSAGSTVVTYNFVTLTNSGEKIAPELGANAGYEHRPFYSELGIMIPIVAGIVIVIIFSVGLFIYLRRKKEMFPENKYGEKTATANEGKDLSSETALMTELERKNCNIASGPSSSSQSTAVAGMGVDSISPRESTYLATPMRVSLGRREDISPYATFRLPMTAGEGSNVEDDVSTSRQRFRHEQRCDKLRMPTSVRHSSKFYESTDLARFPSDSRKEYGSCGDSIYTKIRKKPEYQNDNLDWIPLHSLYQAHRY